MKKELSTSFSTGRLCSMLLTSLLVLFSFSSGFSHSNSDENHALMPMAICQDITVQLDVNGMATIVAEDVDNGSNDNGNPVNLSIDINSFDCDDADMTVVVTLTAESGGLTDDCTANVMVEDNIAPVAICQNATVVLDASGNGSVTGAQINNNSTDACGIGALMVSMSDFTCANVGSNSVTLTVSDMSNNSSTCNATVTVMDNAPPMAMCQNITIQLDGAGNASIIADDVNNNSTDNCPITGTLLSQSNFTCADIGPNNVTLTVADAAGNTDDCIAVVTVEDNEPPVAMCMDATIELDASGNATVTVGQINNGSSDNCGPVSTMLDVTDFTCADVGANTVTLTVTDNDNNSDNCTATVTVEDNMPPNAVCMAATVQLDAAGGGSITGADVDGGSSDNCGVASLAVAPNTFDCDNIGNVNATLTVTDVNGNESTCTAVVTVEDVMNPMAVCQNITAELDATGNATITADAVNNGSSDNCMIASLSLNQTAFSCADIGNQTVTLTVMDQSGNMDTCDATVSVEDNLDPMAVCQNTTVNLDAGGMGSIVAADIDGGSSDNCNNVTLTASQTMFTCADVGDVNVTLTVDDNNGQTATCTAVVTVTEDEDPMAVCANTTIQLDANGMASIVAADVDGGSSDNCTAMADLTLMVSQTDFTCANIGANPVTLTVTDEANNSETCMATVTVEDNVAPMAVCQDVAIQLNAAGNATLTAAQVDNGSSDACGIANISIDQTAFTCANLGSGNTVTLTVTDNNSNQSTCTATITVQDNIAPTAACMGATVQLDAAGMGSITTADINNGSSDNCTAMGDLTLTLSQMDFTCADLGDQDITLTVDDNNGNTSVCLATVQVEDNMSPTAMCQNITIQLNAMGMVSIAASDVDGGSTDNCGAADLDLSVSQMDFTCANVGANTVTLTVTDNAGNDDTCDATVTVEDMNAPVAMCQDISITLDAFGDAAITPAQIDNGSTAACGIMMLELDEDEFTCGDLGDNTVTLTVTGNNGMTATCTANVFVNGTPPTLNCPNDLPIMSNGDCEVAVNYVEPTIDGCNYTLDFQSHSPGDLFPQGSTTVTYIFSNPQQSDTCMFDITVTDMGPGSQPTLNCSNLQPSVDVNADANECFATGLNLTPMQMDDCPDGLVLTFDITGATMSSGMDVISTDSMFNVGTSVVVYTLTDGSNNATTCTFDVNVTDNQAPMVTCPADVNTTTDAGFCTAVVNGIGIVAASDNCMLVDTMYQLTMATAGTGEFDASGETFNIGTTMVTYFVEDNNGLIGTCNFNVIVTDNQNPMITCPGNITVQTDPGMCSFTQPTTDFDATFTDNCPGGMITNDYNDMGTLMGESFPVANSPITVEWTATDNQGNEAMCTFVITVEDNEDPVAMCENITVELSAAGMVSIVAADVENGSTDNCTANTDLILSATPTDFTCVNVGDNDVTLTVEDEAGNTATCIAVVTVEDNTMPSAMCQNITVQLDDNGMATIVASAIDNGSADACGIMNLSASVTTFDCSNVGPNNVNLTVTDNNGNTNTCTAVVTVQDMVAPMAMCQDITVELMAGSVTITANQIDNGSTDNCAVTSLSLDNDTFDCTNVGSNPATNTVTLTVGDMAGNTATCTAVVTVEDNEAPMAECQDIMVQLDVNGMAMIAASDVDNGSSDNCGTVNLSVSPNMFDCSNLGDNTVTLTVTDNDNNSATCTATVTVEDLISPQAICQTATVQLDADGNGTLLAAQVDNNSSDNCGVASLTVSPNMFTCANVGANTVMLTVMDGSGNASTCTTSVTVEDNVAPTAICQDITVAVDGSGNATISANQVDNGSNDACGIASLSLDVFNFDCDDAGENDVTLTVTDNNGNTATCMAVVTIIDDENPNAICQDISVVLDANGMATITADQIDNNSTDNCGVDNISLDITTFTCDDIGANTVTLTVADEAGNTDQCTATVTVQDTSAPTAMCQPADAVTIQLDVNGMATLLASQVDNGSSAPCGNVTLSVSPNMFDCTNVGSNNVMLTVMSDNGNTANCTTSIIVEDATAPNAMCQDITIQLDANGMASIVAADVDGGSTDNCAVTSLMVNQTDFTCNDEGTNTVVLTVGDAAGNTSTCTATVTVEDNVDPVALCQNITVQLDNNGMATITPMQIDNGSNDACGIADLSLDMTTFDCDDIGPNNVVLTVTDNNGNMATCNATVSVVDNVAPMAVCQDITIQLDVAGNATITGADVDGGSTDACGIASLMVDPNTFDCTNVGQNNVTLTVTDNNGNTATCTAVVTVEDDVPPVAMCMDITIQLDANGMASIVAADVDNGSADNCGTVTLSVNPNSFDCSNMGANTVTLTATDGDNNTDTCEATVTVEDSVSPQAICMDATLQLDENGMATLDPSQVDNGSSDACGIIDRTVTPNMFDCSNIGSNMVMLTVEDANGNMSTCTAEVMVMDTVSPMAICQDIDVELDNMGNATIAATDVDNGSSDACGIMSLTLDQFNFDCTDLGENTVTLTVTDNNGNTATCEATVAIEDNMPPMAMCQNISVGIGGMGMVTIMPSQVDNGSTDNCNIADLSLDIDTFTCDDIGDNDVVLTVTDDSDNEATCMAVVTITDSTVPMAVCMDATVQLDATGNVTITPADVDGGSSAACGTMNLVVSPNMFDCDDAGTTVVVTLTASDTNGNSDDCMANVMVQDTVSPVAMCMDITIDLDGSGNYTLMPNEVDNGSSDACGIAMLEVSPNMFDCSNVGINTVILTATDNNNNTDTCQATVAVRASNTCDSPMISNMDGPNIEDPCTCLGNGQFAEEVVITTMGSGQMWEVQSTTLLDPNTGNPYPAGTPFVEQPPMGGMVQYTLEGVHLDGQGYMLSATSPFFPGVVVEISNTCFYPDPVIVTDLSGVICAGTAPITLEGNAGNMTNGDPIAGTGTFTLNGTVITEIDPAQLGTGNFLLTFTFDAGTAGSMDMNDPGCEESITTTFEIQETPDFQGCNNEVTVVLGPTCEALITPDVILEGDFVCVDDYVVTLFNQNGQAVANPITSEFIGQTLTGTVTHTPSGNFCSSPLIVEDSVAPTIDCQPITISCMDALPPFGTGVTGMDNCDANPEEILLNQVFNTDDNCTDAVANDGIAGFVTVTRTYIAEDEGGMQSQPCEQVITITRPDDVDFPDDVIWSCEQYAANPNIIDTFAIHPSIEAGFGTEFPIGANGFAFDLTSMSPNDPRLSNNVPGSTPPTPTGSGLPGVAMGAFCNYSVTSSESVLGTCGFANSTNSPVFKILRTWTVLDWCTGEVITTNNAGEDNVQVIIVMDNQGPTIGGMDVTLSTNIPANGNNPATSNGLIAMPTATDNCTNVEDVQGFVYADANLNNSIANINANGTISPALPVGDYFIAYTATDVCGNVSQSATFTLTITDNSVPTMICDEITEINLPSTGLATVPAGVFDDGSFDDCGMVTFSVRRMDDNCEITGNTTFNPTVTFCCEDVPMSPINVVLQAEDCDGNTNSCMVIVNVGDKIAPILTCPADATIDCDTYNDDLRPQLLVCDLDDACESTALTNAGYGDVVINDNCAATAQPTVTISIGNCGDGTITRSFAGADAAGNASNTCTQTITVTHTSDWVVEFGEDVTLNCGATDSNVSDAFGEPEFFFETCEMIATSFQDETFTTVQDACFKVVRTWRVINWCVVGNDIDQEIDAVELSETALGEDLNGDGVLNTRTFRDSYRGVLPTSDNDVDADNQDGFITYMQTVKVIDDNAPIFVLDCDVPNVCITDNTCGATVTFDAPFVDDCVGEDLVTITATSDLGNGFGPFNDVAPGTYSVTFEAVDNCGNLATCTSSFEVEDCKFPSPVCVEGLVVELMAIDDPNNTSFEPMIEVMIDQINAGSSDNCPLAAGGLKFSFSPDISDVTRTYNCNNIGDNTVRLYVTDGANLQDFCQTEVTVQANQGQCGMLLTATLAGNVATEDVNDVENVMIHINSVDMNMDNMTDAAGMFEMDVPMDGDYTIVPEKDDDHGNGVSTFDLVKISKHILNVTPLDSPYKMIAADANNSQSITTLDLVHIRKLILLINTEFTNNTSWRFVDANYEFPDPANPWLEVFPEIISVNNLEADQLAEDFVAIKIGDVNGTAQVNQLMGADDRTQTKALNLTADNVKMTAGETYAVAINAANFHHFGYQFTMKFDTDKLAFERIEDGLATTENFGTTLAKEGILTTSWNQASAMKWADDQALFTLHFTALTDGNLQEALNLAANYTTAEAYTANGDLATVDLQYNNATTNGFVLYQNRPNPFATETTIGFYLPTAQSATLTITDLAGRTVYTLTDDYQAGMNDITITRNEIAATGVLYYQLETAEGAETRKLVIE